MTASAGGRLELRLGQAQAPDRQNETRTWLLELALTVLLPAALLLPSVRASQGKLLAAQSLVVIGVIANRLNLAVPSLVAANRGVYFPGWEESGAWGVCVDKTLERPHNRVISPTQNVTRRRTDGVLVTGAALGPLQGLG